MNNFKVAAVFSNNMVLQREKNIKVFGEGIDGAKVQVTLANHTVSTTVRNNRWTAVLPPMQAGTGYEMTVECGEVKSVFTNIAIGEVWLAGGQSNMELELQNSTGGLEELKNAQNPNVRFYYTPKNGYMNEKFFADEAASSWHEFDEEHAKYWSAVGYFFAKKVAADLGVTVGIIGCNWGGTSASAWVPQCDLLEDAELTSYVETYTEAVGDKTMEEQINEYAEYISYQGEFDRKVAELYKENPSYTWNEVQEIVGPNRYPGPMNSVNPMRPSGLYETMLKRVMPYTLRGFLYYQGESDDHKGQMYYKLLSRLIRRWREDWDDITLPFLNVQLPMHRYEGDPDYKHWPIVREAQMKVFQTIKNTGIAVILDKGEFNEIHPKDKKPVGERLALQAKRHVYHIASDLEAFGPLYKWAEYKEDGMLLHFDYCDTGFDVSGEVSGFEIAGEDKNFVPAEVEFVDKDIWVTGVANPKYVRYLWTNYGDVTVFGKNGIPLAPFRTSVDDE